MSVAAFAKKRDFDEEVQARQASLKDGYVLDGQGLKITRDLSEAEWLALGPVISQRLTSSNWALGDWLVYGGKGVRGNKYAGPNAWTKAQQVTGLSLAMLDGAYNTALRFPRGTRVMSVSWSHHRYILNSTCPESQVLKWLQRAGEQRWSVDAMVDQIRDKYPPTTPNQFRGVRARAKPMMVECPNCQHKFAVGKRRTR